MDVTVNYYVYMFGKHKPFTYSQHYRSYKVQDIVTKIWTSVRKNDKLHQGYRITHVIQACTDMFCESETEHCIWNTDTTDEQKQRFEDSVVEKVQSLIDKVTRMQTMHNLTTAS